MELLQKIFKQVKTVSEKINTPIYVVGGFVRDFLLGRELKKEVIDPFAGQKDLENKILRTPLDPDQTFIDDPLRMLRAVRFASQLDFSIDPKTLESIYKNRERLKIISAERIQEELFKMMA